MIAVAQDLARDMGTTFVVTPPHTTPFVRETTPSAILFSLTFAHASALVTSCPAVSPGYPSGAIGIPMAVYSRYQYRTPWAVVATGLPVSGSTSVGVAGSCALIELPVAAAAAAAGSGSSSDSTGSHGFTGLSSSSDWSSGTHSQSIIPAESDHCST